MDSKMSNFLRRKGISQEDILYMVRDSRKSSIHLIDNRIIETYIPIKSFIDFFNSELFITINKGITVNASYISSIKDSIYTMSDGKQFKGRTRAPAQHKKNISLITSNSNSKSNENMSTLIPERFSVMDNSPIAFAVIEVTFDDEGHGMDFIFRYCNDAMLKLEELSAEEIVNKSFYEVFKDSNKKWMVSYADVALNGNQKIISYYLKKSNRKVLAYCYQPYERFCACSLIEVESIINVAENLI